MKKSLKALAVLSLFGLGLGSVTACGGSSKSITISVNGTAVGAEGVHVDELSTITFSAIVDNGSESDVIAWATSSPSAFTFDSTTGTEVTATANTPTTTGWTVSASLEGDASVTTSIRVYVDEVAKTYGITVDTSEATTTFVRGDSFTSENLIVNETTFVDGEPKVYYELGSDEYTLSYTEGQILSEEGTFDVTVTANDTSLGNTTYKITVGKNDFYAINRNLEYYEDNVELEMITQEVGVAGESSQLLNNQISASWGDYAFDSSNRALYHSETGGIRKFEFSYDENDNYVLDDAGYIYDSYSPLQGDATLMFDINMTSTAQDLTSDMFTNLVFAEEDAETGATLYVASPSSTSSNVYNYALSYTLFGQAYSILSQIAPSEVYFGVNVIAYDDYTTQIMAMFEAPESYASLLGIPAQGVSILQISPVSLTAEGSIEADLQEMVENKTYGTATNKITSTFRDVVDVVSKGNFDATFGDSLFGDLNYEYHGTDDYVAIAENILNYPTNASGEVIGDPTSIDTSAHIFFDVDGKKFGDHEFSEGTTAIQLVYTSNQDHVEIDENTGAVVGIPTEFDSVADLELTSNNSLEYEGYALTDIQPFHPSTWNGFISEIGNLEMSPIDYWDKSYENTNTTGGVTTVQGSYNLYGSLYLSDGNGGTITNDMWSTLQSFSRYFKIYNEQYLNYSNCKISVSYQLVNDDWSNPESYIRIQTFVADHSSEETWYENLGYVDVMEISNIGSSSYKPADEFVSLLQPVVA